MDFIFYLQCHKVKEEHNRYETKNADSHYLSSFESLLEPLHFALKNKCRSTKPSFNIRAKEEELINIIMHMAEFIPALSQTTALLNSMNNSANPATKAFNEELLLH